MIVYREQREKIPIETALARIWTADARDLPLEFGEFEAGVADALCPTRDEDTPVLRDVRRAAVAIWRRHGNWPVGAWIAAWEAQSPLRGEITISTPEGFAYYGLSPERYAQAAAAFHKELRPRQVVVIGIRSIGTTLSAAVAATLEELGCEVYSYTVRPRGHPFDRHLALAPELEIQWRSLEGAHFAVVDEGPGLSGSSFRCVAERLSQSGIPDERIVLFPSWLADGESFVNEAARERWSRHRKYCVDLRPPVPGSGYADFSAGKWRAHAYAREEDYPAVQPQHERYKYLRCGAEPVLLKFAGLGRYGRAKLDRAKALAAAGFTPCVQGIENGFLMTSYVPGVPCRCASESLLDRIAHYLAHLQHAFPAPRGAAFDELCEMIRVNTGEEFGEEWAARLECLENFRSTVCDSEAVAIDGRMMPHEWLETGSGYLKTDALDHHNDHFFPGCQDIAWDLAGTETEFSLDRGEREFLERRYETLSGDRNLAGRLPFYRIAYPAYRLGYAGLAEHVLGSAPDAERFARLRRNYANQLREALCDG